LAAAAATSCDRKDQAPEVETALTDLSEDEEDEDAVDDVTRGIHVAGIAAGAPGRVGARVDLRVDPASTRVMTLG
jgi:hypothetical protein